MERRRREREGKQNGERREGGGGMIEREEKPYLHHSITPSTMALLQALHYLHININPYTLTNIKSTATKVVLLAEEGKVVTVKSTTLSIGHSLQIRLQQEHVRCSGEYMQVIDLPVLEGGGRERRETDLVTWASSQFPIPPPPPSPPMSIRGDQQLHYMKGDSHLDYRN